MAKRLVIGTTLVALLGALAAILLPQSCNAGRSGGVEAKHISSSEVKLSNLEAFKTQVRRSIPVGTQKQSVETYLVRQKIPHFFAEPNSGAGENTFYGTIKNIGARWGFPANLAIRIHLDQKEKVDQIWFRVDYDAP